MDQNKILVIDDEAGIREGVKRALGAQGLMVITAENGEAGLSIIRDGGIELVLIDIMMPGINGIALISKFHQYDPDIICIIITGYATIDHAVQAIKQGAYDFITKPFSVDNLVLAVNQGLEKRRLAIETKRLQTIELKTQQLAQEKAQLEELDRAKRRFILLLTHELKAPVAAIQNYLQLMLEDYIPAERKIEITYKCKARAEEEMAIISDLLELGRLQSMPAVKLPVPVRQDEILHQIVEDYIESLNKKEIVFHLNIDNNIVPTRGFGDQYINMWTNLLENAIKYTPPGGQITITLQKKENWVHCEISDTGIGIPENEMKYLFTEFFRAQNAKELELPGTGLGLTIVKQIIETVKGKITVKSTLGKGTTFIVELPVAD
ncbi:MAG: hybrid sensor histidine kinase/response regulator [Anaerolineales bacterium]|nr:hybrid sensor histidine kinase/response regulator [Anaerolineales bacterium]